MPKHSKEDILEEERHFAKVVATFEQYGPYAVCILCVVNVREITVME